MTDTSSNRFSLIDSLRGLAVVLMIIFHFCFDLRYFGFVDWDVPNGPGWWQFRYLILSLFIGTVGISLSLARGAGFNRKAFFIRQGKLLIAAALISLMSIFMFPQSWIYFGILHFILVASFICLLLVSRPRLALAIGCIIILSNLMGYFHPYWPFLYVREILPAYTEDFVPFFPWLGVSFIGIFVGDLIRRQQPDFCKVSEPSTAYMGRHALIIYLVHQPLLFAAFSAYIWVLPR